LSLLDRIRKNDDISRLKKIRLWKNDKDLSLEDIFNYIKEKTKRTVSFMSSSIDGKGKMIDDE